MVVDWRRRIQDGPNGCEQLVDAGSFLTRSLSHNLTHLTAEIAFFSPLPSGESDYEKWKSVFNVIQGQVTNANTNTYKLYFTSVSRFERVIKA